MSAMREAYAAEAARLRALPAVPARTPLLVLLGQLLARLVVALPRLRTVALSVGGFGLLSAAAWTVAPAAGLAAAGCSLLVLEYLTGEEGRRR